MTAHFKMTLEMSWFRRSRRLQAMTTLWCCLRRTDRRSQPTGPYPRASTMYPWEFGRPSTFLRAAPFRKARVVGPACTRRCSRFFTSVREKPRNDQRLGSDSKAGLVASTLENVYTNRPSGQSSAILARSFEAGGGPFVGRMRIPSPAAFKVGRKN